MLSLGGQCIGDGIVQVRPGQFLHAVIEDEQVVRLVNTSKEEGTVEQFCIVGTDGLVARDVFNEF